jgi:transposase-like protein
MHGVDAPPTPISSVTEAVMEEVKAWQAGSPLYEGGAAGRRYL